MTGTVEIVYNLIGCSDNTALLSDVCARLHNPTVVVRRHQTPQNGETWYKITGHKNLNGLWGLDDIHVPLYFPDFDVHIMIIETISLFVRNTHWSIRGITASGRYLTFRFFGTTHTIFPQVWGCLKTENICQRKNKMFCGILYDLEINYQTSISSPKWVFLQCVLTSQPWAASFLK